MGEVVATVASRVAVLVADVVGFGAIAAAVSALAGNVCVLVDDVRGFGEVADTEAVAVDKPVPEKPDEKPELKALPTTFSTREMSETSDVPDVLL